MMTVLIACLVFLSAASAAAGAAARRKTASIGAALAPRARDRAEQKPGFLDALWGAPPGGAFLPADFRPKSAAAGAALGLLAGVAAGPGAALLLGAAGFVLAPRMVGSHHRKKFVEAFRKQFPRGINLVVAYAAAGSLVEAFSRAAADLPWPVCDVFGYIHTCVRESGYTLYGAVKKAAAEYGLEELDKFAESVRIIEEIGAGEKAREVLDMAAEEVRFAERFRIAVEANLAEIKNAALIADLVPIAVFAGFALFIPDSEHRYVLMHDRTLVFLGLLAVAAGWAYASSVVRKFRESV